MTHKDPNRRRAYMRRYMKRRRATNVNPHVNPPTIQRHEEQAKSPTRSIDWSRPYHEESRFPYPRYLVQDGFWYHPDTGELVKPAPR